MSYDCGDSVFAVSGLSAAGDTLLPAGDVYCAGTWRCDAAAVNGVLRLPLCGRRLEEGYPCRCLLLKYDEEEIGDIALGQEILL